MSHASQQYAFTEPRTVKRAQVKPSEREHQTSSSAPRVSLAPAADRTLDILEFIASNGQTQAATLARELGIPRSTVYQLLEILERHGLVTRLAEQRAYGIGLKTFELGSAYSRQHRVSQVAHPVLARLVDETGENGHLAVLHGNEIIYVIEERAAHRPPLVSGVGVRLPSHLTATGRAILSALPRNQVRALYPNRQAFTDRTGIGPKSPKELEKLSALGKSYLGALRREVRRLMLVADETLDGAVAESVTEKLGERELLELKKAFGARAAKKLGTNVQIVDPREVREENERDFCV